ncbi:ribonuclease III [Natronoflexus pectinivorans]|uniref:Ribonuclease 3 n=1 Tax=Natronoflexus pectinivorans TaxID=682526 RepID=A0A4R2GKW5_9BACT|nr:ribonuclease III [Natronoflexus pectinivorans]TCO09602.1 ribonuclease-3 [Natronoflexus pectinivorans]
MLKDLFTSVKLLTRKGKKFSCLIHKVTGFYPKNPEYYRLAFQHKSLMMRDETGMPVNNERLEYLGDAVLSAVVAHELFMRFPEKDEGALTKMRSRIVNRTTLNHLAAKMGLNKLIKTQPLNDLAQTHIPGDALEALIGAVYLDRGYLCARSFIISGIMEHFNDEEALVENDTNFKSLLIEWAQKNRCDIHFITEEHHPNLPSRETAFIAKACIDGQVIGEGNGASKKEAQQNAAGHALKSLDSYAFDFSGLQDQTLLTT